MALYINQTGKLKEVKEKPFKLEKDIQKHRALQKTKYRQQTLKTLLLNYGK